MGTVLIHSFTTDKVDASIGPTKYHFKKKFESKTGLGAQLVWDTSDGQLFLEHAKGHGGKGGEAGGIVARFIPRDSKIGSTQRNEGRFEFRQPGLNDAQIEEIFITGIAELERRKSYATDAKAASHVASAVAG